MLAAVAYGDPFEVVRNTGCATPGCPC